MRINTSLATYGIPPRGMASITLHNIWSGVIDWDENLERVFLPNDLAEEIPKLLGTHLLLVLDCPAFNLTMEITLNIGPYGAKINREQPESTVNRFKEILNRFFEEYLLPGE